MLMIIAYDIAEPRRLQKVARLCEDFGIRVQLSVFECRLEADRFDEFWKRLHELLKPEEDSVVAYRVCTRCAREVRTAGTMVHTEKVVAYVC